MLYPQLEPINKPINVTAAGDNVILSNTSDVAVNVSEMIFSPSVAMTVQIKVGTNVIATHNLGINQGLTISNVINDSNQRIILPQGKNLILNLSTAGTVSGTIRYALLNVAEKGSVI